MSRAFLVASAIALLPASAFAYINAGFKSQAEYDRYLRQQRTATIGRATEAIRRDPTDAVAYFYRGNIHCEGGRMGNNYEAALADYDKAIQLDPKFAQAYFRRGQVRLRVHGLAGWNKIIPIKETEALADIEKATQLNPKLVAAQLLFAASTKDNAKAIESAKKACKHTGYKDEFCLQLLAFFYAKGGDFDNAVRWQEKALQLPVFNEEDAKKRLANYRQKKPDQWGINWWYLVEYRYR